MNKEVKWEKHMPMENSLEAKNILDTRLAKKTRGREYLDYLVKWKECPKEDATWMNVADIEKKDYSIEELMNRDS